MPSDVRLREEMERLTRPLDETPEDLDAVLGDVTRRTASRRMKKRLGVGGALIVAAALGVWAAPSISDAFSADPLPPVNAPEETLDPMVAEIAGAYTSDVRAEGPAARSHRINGRWELSLTAEGTVTAVPPAGYRDLVGLPEPATFRIEDGIFVSRVLTHEGLGCVGEGRYRIEQIEGGLTFETVQDSCPWRADAFTAGTWEKGEPSE